MLFFQQVGYSGQPLGEDVHFAVVHSAWYPSGSAAVIHVICVHVDATKDVDSQQDDVPLFTTKLEWLTFFSSGYLLRFVTTNTLLLLYLRISLISSGGMKRPWLSVYCFDLINHINLDWH